MKTIYSILIILLMFTANAQEVKIQSKPFTFTTEQQAIGGAFKTPKYVKVKGVEHTLYQTARGSWYYITQTKTGEYKRNYVKVTPAVN